MTRAERRRLLDPERKLAFAAEMGALMAKYGYQRGAAFICIKVREDDTPPERWVIDHDGDLANIEQMSRPWDEAAIAMHRAEYEERVAKGKFDKDTDTDEEEVPAPKAKPKPKPKLTLPLTVGQKVVLLNGSKATVSTVKAERAYTEHGWHLTADGQYGRSDYSEPYPLDIVADAELEATLALPLTDGQRVVLRDGTLATVANCDTATCKVVPDGGGPGKLVWSKVGRRFRSGAEDPRDAMADA